MNTRMKILFLLALLTQLGIVILFLYLGLQFPAPAIPASVGAVLGAIRHRRTQRAPIAGVSPPDLARHVQTEWQQAFAASLWPGLGLGAIGYAALAAIGVGVPDAAVPIGWRILGGITFGALGGVGAALTIMAATTLAQGARLLRRNRHATQGAA